MLLRVRPVGPRRRRQLRLHRRHAARAGDGALGPEASSFDWSLIPGTITVHIGGLRRLVLGLRATSTWTPPSLDSGRFAWGVVQHEFAPPGRLLPLRRRASGHSCSQCARRQGLVLSVPSLDALRLRLRALRLELAWAYWQSPDNVMKPQKTERRVAASCPCAQFRALARPAARRAGDCAAARRRRRSPRRSRHAAGEAATSGAAATRSAGRAAHGRPPACACRRRACPSPCARACAPFPPR